MGTISLMNDTDICETLIEEPGSASQFLTTLTCNQNYLEIMVYYSKCTRCYINCKLILQNQYDSSADLNGDGGVNVQDVILT